MSLFLISTLRTLLTSLENPNLTPESGLRVVTRHKVSLANIMPIAYGGRIKQIPGVEQVTATQWFGGIYKDPANFGSSAEFVGKTVFHRRLRRPRCSPSLKASLASSAAAPALTLGCAPRCRLVWAMGNGASGGGSGHRV